MDHHLREGLSWCLCEGRLVLLDLPADRYFALPADLEPCFLAWARRGSEGAGQAGIGRLRRLGLIVPGAGPAGPASLEPPDHDLLARMPARPGAPEILRAGIALLRARHALRRRGAAAILPPVGPSRRRNRPPDPREKAARIAASFESLGLWLGRTDRCLARALALWTLCRRAGIGAALVLGVRRSPFTAHAWVQLGEAVLIGEQEQARLFTPILVAR